MHRASESHHTPLETTPRNQNDGYKQLKARTSAVMVTQALARHATRL
jgi:hypothetical protein